MKVSATGVNLPIVKRSAHLILWLFQFLWKEFVWREMIWCIPTPSNAWISTRILLRKSSASLLSHLRCRSCASRTTCAAVNTQSTHGFLSLQHGQYIGMCSPYSFLIGDFFLLNRLPLKSTLLCAVMALVQVYIFFWFPVTYFTFLPFNMGVVFHIQAMLADVKSLFDRIDKLLRSGERTAELAILEHCKEAIDLHSRIYRQ